MLTLSNDAVWTLPDEVRREFDAWIDAEGLADKFIISGSFDTPGEIRAQVPVWGEDGQAKLNEEHDDIVTVERVFPIKTPLPASVRPYLRNVE